MIEYDNTPRTTEEQVAYCPCCEEQSFVTPEEVDMGEYYCGFCDQVVGCEV